LGRRRRGAFRAQFIRDLTDKDGIKLVDALAKFGVNLDTAKQSCRQLENAAAYLELHIEQGPVLESLDLPLGVVLGTFGVERHSIRFTGQSAHAGSTPMDKRRDAFGAAAKLGLEIREIGKRNGGVCTVGRVDTRPGIVTAVVGQCDMTLDQRHLDAEALARMLAEAKAASTRFAQEENVTEEWKKLWEIHPIPFHPQLIEFADEAIRETCGTSHQLPSGPLHDAAEVARAGVPTIMLFVQSLRGLSHAKEEDTREEHIAMSVEALDRLATKTIQWIQSQ
jgi:beta-ureidopropionase / N-carbamoyl-L-amino-acid hydrolase